MAAIIIKKNSFGCYMYIDDKKSDSAYMQSNKNFFLVILGCSNTAGRYLYGLLVLQGYIKISAFVFVQYDNVNICLTVCLKINQRREIRRRCSNKLTNKNPLLKVMLFS